VVFAEHEPAESQFVAATICFESAPYSISIRRKVSALLRASLSVQFSDPVLSQKPVTNTRAAGRARSQHAAWVIERISGFSRVEVEDAT